MIAEAPGSSRYLGVGNAGVHSGVQQSGVRLSAQPAAGSLLAGAAGVTLPQTAVAQALHPQEANLLLVRDLGHRYALLHCVLAATAVQAGGGKRAHLCARSRDCVCWLSGGIEAPLAAAPLL